MSGPDMGALASAELLVDSFIAEHRNAAIPALIAACVGWAARHGAHDLIRSTMQNAIELSHNAEAVLKAARQ